MSDFPGSGGTAHRRACDDLATLHVDRPH